MDLEEELKEGLKFLGEKPDPNQICKCGCGRMCDEQNAYGTRDLGFPYYSKDCVEEAKFNAQLEELYDL